jgi:glutamate---cysteine ligase / carboxylate-amine ligase
MTGMPWPSWARWSEGAGRYYTVGVEEEVMLLDPSDDSLSESSDGVLRRLSRELAAHMRPETHAAVVELATGIHVQVAVAVAELAALRSRLSRELREMGIGVAPAGMHPLAAARETRVSGSERYRSWLIRCARWRTGSPRWPCMCT